MDKKAENNQTDKEKVLNIIKNVVTWLVVAAAVAMMIFTIISATTLDRNNRSLFGKKMFIVNSDSMKATDFAAGDLIFVKEVDPSTLKEGDIISYTSTNTENFGELITHKIKKLTVTASGEPGFITYGTTTGEEDKTIVTYPYIVGKYTGKIAKMGYFFQFLKTTPGYIVCILVPFMLLIISQAWTSIKLFKQYKAEQNAALEEEKSKIAAEKEETQRMMAELLAMKAQMEQQGGAPITTPGTAPFQTQTPPPSPAPEAPKANQNAERIALLEKDLAEVEKNIAELRAAKEELEATYKTAETESQISELSVTIGKLTAVKVQISAELQNLKN
ncbi:MAG: signal peptidase I [Clostridiales bacterium]|nr:signal peptidase I [Clostridiales bacterium]